MNKWVSWCLVVALSATLIVGTLTGCDDDENETIPTSNQTTPPTSIPTPDTVPSQTPTLTPETTLTPTPTPTTSPETTPEPTPTPSPTSPPPTDQPAAPEAESTLPSETTQETPQTPPQGEDTITISLPFVSEDAPYTLIPIGETVNHPEPDNPHGHTGIDFHWDRSVPLISSVSGRVDSIQPSGWEGKWDVSVRSGAFNIEYRGLETVNPELEVGMVLETGKLIGYPQNASPDPEQPFWMIHWETGWFSGDQGYSEAICPYSYLDMDSLALIELIWQRTQWEHKGSFPYICSGDYRDEAEPLLASPPPEEVPATQPSEDSDDTPAQTPADIPTRVPWIEGAITQPVPEHGSSVRLGLPVPVEQILFTETSGIGGFGIHAGGHKEGLDHVWMSVTEDAIIGSWGDGVVTNVIPSGDIELGEHMITVYYGDGLYGHHGEILNPLVAVDDEVNEGDPIGIGMQFTPGIQSAEFGLYDQNRRDGLGDDSGSNVSPFDYLRDDVKQQLVERYTRDVLPHLAQGFSWAAQNPWEPYLTNPILIHDNHEGTLAGEWLLNEQWADGGHPDILTFLDVDHQYYRGRRVAAMDDTGAIRRWWGTWDADYELNRVMIHSEGPIVYYGIFELDESGERAILKLEYREGTYPTAFSENAATYIERAPLSRRADAVQLGVLENM